MKTSSSEGTIGRTLEACDARRRRGAVEDGFARSRDRRSIQTCRRSPKTCALAMSGWPVSLSSASRGSETTTSNRVPGRPARSRPGSSSASTWPSCSSAIRAQRSASSRYGVDIRMVMPCARNCDSSFQNSRRDTGSTPVVGSSSTITCGSWTRVQASASFCFMPPDSWSARRPRNGVSCVISSRRSRRAWKSRDAVNLREERDVLVDAEIAVEPEALRQVADRRR